MLESTKDKMLKIAGEGEQCFYDNGMYGRNKCPYPPDSVERAAWNIGFRDAENDTLNLIAITPMSYALLEPIKEAIDKAVANASDRDQSNLLLAHVQEYINERLEEMATAARAEDA